jgi:tetratricopeptide (TPR) repeat protein
MQSERPPFVFTYWNPFSENANLIENWFDYVKNVSLAKYTADSVGRYIQQTSADQIKTIDATGRRICGELYTGFFALEKELGLVSDRLGEISNTLQGIDSRLGLLVDEAKTSNLLLENVAELLRIPDSQKQRQHHIEMGLKFLKNALKDEDLYQDALTELLGAEKLMPYDYFVLHRIGMIYLLVPALGNLEKAAEYFTKAGKYAAVESDPKAARLGNMLNKQVNKRFNEQAETPAEDISALAAESYLQAGTSLYALGRFEDAPKMAEKAVKYHPGEAKYHFFSAKYLTRAGRPDAAVPNLQKAVELVPEMALAAVRDFDLNKAQPILDLLNHLDAEVSGQLQSSIKVLRGWPQNGYRFDKVQQLATDSQNSLEKINYAEKISLLAKLKKWELRLPFIDQLTEIAAFEISFNAAEAVQLLRQNSPANAEKVWAEKIFKGFCLFSKLQKISVKENPTFIEQVLLATANGRFIPYEDKNIIEHFIALLLAGEDDKEPLIKLYDDYILRSIKNNKDEWSIERLRSERLRHIKGSVEWLQDRSFGDMDDPTLIKYKTELENHGIIKETTKLIILINLDLTYPKIGHVEDPDEKMDNFMSEIGRDCDAVQKDEQKIEMQEFLDSVRATLISIQQRYSPSLSNAPKTADELKAATEPSKVSGLDEGKGFSERLLRLLASIGREVFGLDTGNKNQNKAKPK